MFGLILYGNGIGAVPDEPGREPGRTRQGLRRISWGDLFVRMKTSVKDLLDGEASRERRLTAIGALCVLVGLVASALAVLAFITAMV
ncbi:hypothetical protein [Mycolicibacterium sp. GF69]|uniref:hypothetical protein n=1 Tax=Mycolicibacterium sp. GF69 TaxID=2267251 RepID=UPI001403BDA3|nr:hypothetical protein [Mycolicibacterium sp. GF69]